MIDSNALLVGALTLLPFAAQRFTGKFIYFAAFAIIAIIFQGVYLFGPSILYLLIVTYIISTVAELVSLKTPIYCFGVKYSYNLKHPFFSSKIYLLGVYPLEISLAWVIFKYLSFIIAVLITAAFSLSVFWEIVLIPLILVSLDFLIDPIAVNISKLWRWERGSFYFGIPWQNFLGWYIVGLVSTLIFVWVGHWQPVRFDYFLIFPVVFYASFLRHITRLIKLDVRLGMLGSLPAMIWTILGLVSLTVLFLK